MNNQPVNEDDCKWIDANYKFLKDLERKHKMQVSNTQTDQYLLDVFPETQEIIPVKLEEYWKEAAESYRRLKEIRRIVDKIQTDPFSKWFFTQAEKYKEGIRLKWLYQQIRTLRKLKMVFEKNRVRQQLSKEFFKTKEEQKKFDIDRMFGHEHLLVEIILFDGIKLEKSGEKFVGLCPFHSEKSPSFFVYPDNWAHCFGCSWHGNFIDYLTKKRNCAFKEALEQANRFM